jgi:hypothetical protein
MTMTHKKQTKQKTINTAKQIKCYFYFVSSNGNSNSNSNNTTTKIFMFDMKVGLHAIHRQT